MHQHPCAPRRPLAWVAITAALAFSSALVHGGVGAQTKDPFLEKAAQAKGAVVTASGLVFETLQEGKGNKPAATDTVKVHYRGTLTDGREFDSSYKRNEPAQFPLNRVIKCWTEGVQMIRVGGKARLTCPSEIAYGSRGASTVIPPNAVLQFEVELLDVLPTR
jgi:FKBP-type peptidyl-prolyl cis-trans isomerase FkpA